jgi:hypothetical protein
MLPSRMNMRVIDITLNDVYKGVKLYIEGYKLRVDLMSLNLYDFNLIFGTNWLGVHRAQIDCFTKMMKYLVFFLNVAKKL